MDPRPFALHGSGVHVRAAPAAIPANLRYAWKMITAWRDDYSHHRPNESLDWFIPREYQQRSIEVQTLNSANEQPRPPRGQATTDE